MIPHRCDERCVCPVHRTPLLFVPFSSEHTCQDGDCRYGAGLERRLLEEIRALRTRD